MLIRTLLLLQEGESKLFSDYFELLHNTSTDIIALITSLQEKSFILKSYKLPTKGDILDPYSISINKTFIKKFYKASNELGKELFDAYPQFCVIQNSMVGLRSISKKFDSLEDAFFKYAKSINWSTERHNHIIELIEWGKEHNLINYSLANFICDQRWIELEALHDGGSNINYDTIELL